jgi:hypothetical protein
LRQTTGIILKMITTTSAGRSEGSCQRNNQLFMLGIEDRMTLGDPNRMEVITC